MTRQIIPAKGRRHYAFCFPLICPTWTMFKPDKKWMVLPVDYYNLNAIVPAIKTFVLNIIKISDCPFNNWKILCYYTFGKYVLLHFCFHSLSVTICLHLWWDIIHFYLAVHGYLNSPALPRSWRHDLHHRHLPPGTQVWYYTDHILFIWDSFDTFIQDVQMWRSSPKGMNHCTTNEPQ